VLIDELGKGTEVRAGTALAAAMLEGMVKASCAGVFATHLHLMHCLRLNTAPGPGPGGLTYWRMDVQDRAWRGPGPYPLAGGRLQQQGGLAGRAGLVRRVGLPLHACLQLPWLA
jgi:hypothetical protein